MYSGVLAFLLFVFQAKSGTTNNDRTGLGDISYLSPFSRDLDDIKKFQKSLQSIEKNRFEFFFIIFV